MGQLLIFVPTLTVPGQNELMTLGIDDLVSDGASWQPLSSGPGGEPGLVAVTVDQQGDLPSGQWHWIQADGHAYGYKTDDPPAPSDLEREGAKGSPLQLIDGNEWIIPDLRSTADATLRSLIEEIRAFFSQDDFHCGYQGQTYIPGSFLIVKAALRHNYRLPPHVAGIDGLDLFDLPTLSVALLYAIGVKSDVQLHDSIEEN